MSKEINPPQEVLEALYPAVGAVVIYWSLLEQAMEHWVAMIYRHPGGDKGWKQVPYLLRPKIEYLRTKFGDMPDLASCSKDGLTLLEKIEKIAQIRDIMVHGAISSYHPETEMLKFVRLQVDKAKKIHVITPDYATVLEILEASGFILTLMTEAFHFGQVLADHLLGKDRVDDSSGD
jgi:hypothetical protein